MDKTPHVTHCSTHTLLVLLAPLSLTQGTIYTQTGGWVRTSCGGCILMDAWWVPLIQQDVSREGSRALSDANHSPMAAQHNPAPSRGNADTLRAQSPQADTVFVQFNPSFRLVFLFSCPSPHCWVLGWVDEVSHGLGWRI